LGTLRELYGNASGTFVGIPWEHFGNFVGTRGYVFRILLL
jgi:hypothetical protein